MTSSLHPYRKLALAVLVHALASSPALANRTGQELVADLHFASVQAMLASSERARVQRMVEQLRSRLPASMECLWFMADVSAVVVNKQEPSEEQWRLAHERLSRVRELLTSLGLKNIPRYVFSVNHIQPLLAGQDGDAIELILRFDTAYSRKIADESVNCEWRPEP